MKISSMGCAVGLAVALFAMAGASPAAAQDPKAAELCTPDVMRLCNEFVPDVDRIYRLHAEEAAAAQLGMRGSV